MNDRDTQYLVITRGCLDDLPIRVVDDLGTAQAIAEDFDPETLDALPARACMLGRCRASNVSHVDIIELLHGLPVRRLLHRPVDSNRKDNGRKFH